MRSPLLLTTRTSKKIKDKLNMAAAGSGSQKLTFYEDRYLKPHKKSASMPGRQSAPPTPMLRKTERRQASMSEFCPDSSSKSPVNNPLLDSPPLSRPLTLAANTTVEGQARSGDNNNNNNDYQKLSAVTRRPKPDSNNIYENHRHIRPTRAHKSSDATAEHVYETIPANFPFFYQGTLADEDNYIVSRGAAKSHETSKQSANTLNNKSKEATTTNLRAMRNIGWSVDSMRLVPENKLRSQSTILAPKLWVKATPTGLANSTSCDNLSNKNLEQIKLLAMANPEKENRYPYTCLTKRAGEGRNSEHRQHTSPKDKRLTDTASHRDSSSSSSSATLKSASSQKIQPNHRHSASYSGYPSTYENIANVHKNLKPAHSEYVNIEEYLNQSSDLNYADLDLTLQKPKRFVSTSNRHCRSASASPTKQTNILGESNDDSVEYTFINIAATEAARLACKEHQQDRQRRTPTTSYT